jgi:GR25 family glycosyltransferase involved in LPS biosynthesis
MFNSYIKNLHINQLSNALKHRKAYELIAKRSNDNEINIILEDDVLYEEQRLCASLDKLVFSLPSTYDIVFLGMPTKTASPPPSDTYNFQNTRETFDVLPFCDSYIISHSACKALLPHFSPIKFCTQVQLSFMSYKLGLTTLQSLPNIFIDGSKYGMFLSKLNTNNPLIFNNDFTSLRTIVTREHINEQNKNEVQKILSMTPLKHNPDFLHLECLFHMKNKDYEKARQKFEEAYNVYMSNGCILSHDSVFLRDYIFLHKHLQKDIRQPETS